VVGIIKVVENTLCAMELLEMSTNHDYMNELFVTSLFIFFSLENVYILLTPGIELASI